MGRFFLRRSACAWLFPDVYGSSAWLHVGLGLFGPVLSFLGRPTRITEKKIRKFLKMYAGCFSYKGGETLTTFVSLFYYLFYCCCCCVHVVTTASVLRLVQSSP